MSTKKIYSLVRNGSSVVVTLPHHVLAHLGWQAGDPVALELLEDNSLLVRQPVLEDLWSNRRPPPLKAGLEPVGVK